MESRGRRTSVLSFGRFRGNTAFNLDDGHNNLPEDTSFFSFSMNQLTGDLDLRKKSYKISSHGRNAFITHGRKI